MEIGEIFNSAFGWLFKLIPYKNASKWLEVYTKPHETMTRELGKGSVGDGIKNILIASVLQMLVLVVVILIQFGLAASSVSASKVIPIVPIASIFGIMMIFSIVILAPIATVLFALIVSAFYWIFAKILGGKSNFENQFYIMSLVFSGNWIIGIPFVILVMIPYVGLVFSVISIAISIYCIYLNMKTIRLTHGISREKAAIVILLPTIILMIILVAIFVVVLGGLFIVPYQTTSTYSLSP
ncbi:MAG: Yip1 family protein [Candidatus Micrarchaeota archaeon]|nr:Yip1 family protein [Candidatus Micrarchaeota archaeon]